MFFEKLKFQSNITKSEAERIQLIRNYIFFYIFAADFNQRPDTGV